MESYPATQIKLREALRAAFPSSTTPTVEEILAADIPYLDATCEEGFRLAGVAKGNLRQATVNTEVLGHQIPKGAQILMNFHVNRTPALVESRRVADSKAAIAEPLDEFLNNADRDLGIFEPRRWLIKDEKTGKEAFNPLVFPSLAFSGGYRGCSGKSS